VRLPLLRETPRHIGVLRGSLILMVFKNINIALIRMNHPKICWRTEIAAGGCVVTNSSNPQLFVSIKITQLLLKFPCRFGHAFSRSNFRR